MAWKANIGWSISAALVSIAIIVHTVTVLNFGDGLALHAQSFRDVYITGAVVGFGVLNWKRLRFSNALIPFLVLAIYVATILMLHSFPLYAGMWVLWALYLGMFFPCSNWLDSRRNTSKFVGTILMVLSALLLWGYWAAESKGVALKWEGERTRLTGGMGNPVPFAKMVATLFWLSLLQAILTNKKRYIALTVVSLWVLVQTDVRAELIGVMLGSMTYFSYKYQLGLIKWVALVVIVVLAVFVFVLTDYQTLNDYSSGRVELWDFLIQHTIHDGSITTYLFGTGESLLGKYHYDNLYMEIALRYGLLGGMILLTALVMSIRKIGNQVFVATPGFQRQILSWSIAVLAALCTSGLFSMEFPSLGNSLNILLLPLAFSFSTQGEK